MDSNNLLLYGQSVEFYYINESWTDSERKWALEPESKPEIEGIHLHHKDMSN